jgi:hypothetical protein
LPRIHGIEMTRRLLPRVFVTALAAAASVDELKDTINLGLEAYESKDCRLAIDDLNHVVAQLQEKLNAENANPLPELLDVWTASEITKCSTKARST